MEQELPLEPARGNIDRNNYIGVKAITFDELNSTISMDLPGRFPITPVRGNAYNLVMYKSYSNSILAVPIKDITKQSLTQGYKYFFIDPYKIRNQTNLAPPG